MDIVMPISNQFGFAPRQADDAVKTDQYYGQDKEEFDTEMFHFKLLRSKLRAAASLLDGVVGRDNTGYGTPGDLKLQIVRLNSQY